MNRRLDPKELTVSLVLPRSQCQVRVGAVITDRSGVNFSVGWNNSGRDGLGEHAEAYAIRNANRKRLPGSTIYVAGIRVRNGNFVPSRPCDDCRRLLKKYRIKKAVYITPTGNWITECI